MKNVAFLFAFVIIALASCQKNDTEAVQPENSTPNFQIFFGDENLKSGGTIIENGDTITMFKNYQTIFWTENEDGSPIKIFWEVEQTLSEDPPYVFSPQHSTFSDIMAYKATDVGYYKFTIADYPNGPAVKTFYALVRTLNYPGQIGDGPEEDYIFRLEKKYYSSTGENKLFLYFKYSDEYSADQVGAYLTGWPPGGAINLELSAYQFNWTNDKYFYCILDIPDEMNNTAAGIVFWSYTGGGDTDIDPNNYLSSWYTDYGSIQFLIK